MRKQLLTALLLGACAFIAHGATVSINGQNKNTIGTIININQGDISCYLTLKSDDGKVFQESASFDLCDEKLKGQRVQLTYSMENVQARSCQGDQSCKKTDRIALITAAKRVGAAQAAPTSQTSFCSANETLVFSCTSGKKMASVCASRNASPTTGYVQYRFGTPGQPLEMTWPEAEVLPTKAAYGAFDPYAGGGASWLRFRKGVYSYVVYSGVGRWGPKGQSMEKQGVAVESAGKVIAHLKYNGRNTGELGPDWLAKAGYQRTDREEFFIPE